MLSKHFGHYAIHIRPYQLTSFISQHLLYIIVRMHDFTQSLLAAINNDDCRLGVVCVLVGVVVDLGGLLQVL